MIELLKRINLICIIFILQMLNNPRQHLKVIVRKMRNPKGSYKHEELADAIVKNNIDRIKEQFLLIQQDDTLFDIHPYLTLALEKSNFQALEQLLEYAPSDYNFSGLTEQIFDHLILVPFNSPYSFFPKIYLTPAIKTNLTSIFEIIAANGGLHPNKPFKYYTLFGFVAELQLTEALPLFFKYKADPYVTSSINTGFIPDAFHFYNPFVTFFVNRNLEGIELFLQNGFDSNHKLEFKPASARDQIFKYMEKDIKAARSLTGDTFLFYKELFKNPLAMEKIINPIFKKFPHARNKWNAIFLEPADKDHALIPAQDYKSKKEKIPKKNNVTHTPVTYKLYKPEINDTDIVPKKTPVENTSQVTESTPNTPPAKKNIEHKKNKLRSKDILLTITDRQIERERARALEKKQKQEEAEARKLAKEQKQKTEYETTKQKSISLTSAAKPATATLAPLNQTRQNPFHNKLRTLRLNEACKHLIFIKRIAASEVALEDNVVHYALLYNIFRCFVSLKEYQQVGGNSTSLLNKDSVVNMRNLIRHYGICDVTHSAVLEFANQIKGKLPKELLNFKQDHLWQFELSDEMRKSLCREFDITDKNNYFFEFDEFPLMIEDSRLFKQLKTFLVAQNGDEKTAPTDIRTHDRKAIIETFIPQIISLLKTIEKMPLKDRHENPTLFTNTYLTHLQVIRYLVLVCAEYRLSFLDCNKALSKFLAYCHDEGCHMAHAMVDLDAPVYFANILESKFTKYCKVEIDNQSLSCQAPTFFSTATATRSTDATDSSKNVRGSKSLTKHFP